MSDLLAAVWGDTHWADGGGEDRANYAGAESVLSEVVKDKPPYVVLNGDFLELWKCDERHVLDFSGDRLRCLIRTLDQLCVWWWWNLGNHDGIPGGKAAKILADHGARKFNVVKGPLILGPWQIEHGHRFDWWCNPKSPLYWFSYGLTRTVGEIEDHLWHDLPEGKLNPTDWGANAKDNELRDAIHDRANHWAAKNSARLCFNHTHSPYTLRGDDWCVINTGCVTEGRASYGLLYTDGTAERRILQGFEGARCRPSTSFRSDS